MPSLSPAGQQRGLGVAGQEASQAVHGAFNNYIQMHLDLEKQYE